MRTTEVCERERASKRERERESERERHTQEEIETRITSFKSGLVLTCTR